MEQLQELENIKLKYLPSYSSELNPSSIYGRILEKMLHAITSLNPYQKLYKPYVSISLMFKDALAKLSGFAHICCNTLVFICLFEGLNYIVGSELPPVKLTGGSSYPSNNLFIVSISPCFLIQQFFICCNLLVVPDWK